MIIVNTTVDHDVHIAEDMIVSYRFNDTMPHNWSLTDNGELHWSGDSNKFRCVKSGVIHHINKNTFYSVKYNWRGHIKTVRQVTEEEKNTFSWGVTIYTTADCGWHHCYFNTKEEQMALAKKVQNAIELREHNLRVQSDYASTALHRIQG